MTDAAPDLSRLRIPREGPRGGGRRAGRGGWLVACLLLLLFGAYAAVREGWVPQDTLPDWLRTQDMRPLLRTARVVRTGGVLPPSGVSANGYVVARKRAALSTDIQGRIVEITVEEGDRVIKGQLIARLDTRQFLSELAAAQAERKRQEASLHRADLDFGRYDSLVATGEVSVAEADGARATLDEATAQLTALDAQIERVEVMIDKSSVFAPFAGRITAKNAEVGEVVAALGASGPAAGGSVATLVDFDTLEVQVELAQTSLAAAVEGASATIYLDAWPDVDYPGRVRQIWPTANRTKATVEVRIVFLERSDRILPEMGVRVIFGVPGAGQGSEPGSEPEPVQVIVPEDALLSRVQGGGRGTGKDTGMQQAVWLVLDGHLERREIVLESEPAAGRAAVASGLTGGEQVVLDPAPELSAGQAVRTGSDG
jgi:HlyD family secretion protein